MEAMLACYIAKVNDAHLKVAATESTAEAIEATGRRRYERQRRTGRIARRGGQALLRRAGRPAAGRPSCGGQPRATKSTATAAAMWTSERDGEQPFDPAKRDRFSG